MMTAGRLSMGLLLLLAVPGAMADETPKLSAKLHAAHTAIAPGGETTLAIELTLTKGWHLYHPIILDTGFPTTVEFTAPPGVTFGRVEFPTPELGVAFEQEYLGLEGAITLVAPVKLDESVPAGRDLAISVEVKALACIEKCVPVQASAELTLPVSAGVKPQHEGAKRIELARKLMPPPLAEAPYLKGSTITIAQPTLRIGEKTELVATLRVAPGHHIQDRDPGNPDLIPTRIFVESVDGLTLGDQVWPAAKAAEIPGVGTVRKQSGEFVVRIPIDAADRKFEPRPVKLRTLVQYQACTETGQCFRPTMAESFVSFEVLSAESSPGVQPPPAAAATGGKATGTPGGVVAPHAPPNIAWIFLMAFVGGMILNVMPCVLPVLSLKIFSFVHQAGEDRRRLLALGLVYGAGVLASFALLALVMMGALSALGVEQDSWGIWMQQPVYVIAMCIIVLLLALSLFGVFELKLPGRVEGAAAQAASREGFGGAFMNGLLAVALASACTAPAMGYAIGALVQLPRPVMFGGMLTIGLGMAAPYVLLSAFPQWLKVVPRPGKWMNTVKEFMGFLLIGTLIWLLWILQYLVSPSHLIATLAMLAFIALACWIYGKLPLTASSARVFGTYAAIAVILLAGWRVSFGYLGGDKPLLAQQTEENSGGSGGGVAAQQAVDGGITWVKWEPGLPEKLAEAGNTVYVDFTAKWCANCQANKNLVLLADPVKARLLSDRVVMVVADWTKPNKQIAEELRRFNRAGVPLNVIYPAGKPSEPITLPELLTTDIVMSALDKAGSGKSPSVAARGAVANPEQQ